MLSLSLAAQMTAAAVERAGELGAAVSVAVVDAGGNLVCFQRMDGAEIAGPTLAVDKAYTAVAHRVSTAELTARAAPGGDLAGLHANGSGRYVVFGGGLPCWAEGSVVGAVGVSGGTVEEDETSAAAALAAFQGATTEISAG
jgi:uncharacterized protein GlcG (DUF336 family)